MDFVAPELVALAVVFTFVNGMNDGGALLSVGVKLEQAHVVLPLVVLVGAVVVAPWLFGTSVAETFVGRLVDFSGPAGRRSLTVAIVAAIVVVVSLGRAGLPTSLTLATIGGMVGGGVGAGQTVDWPILTTVLLLAAVAPVIGVVGAAALSVAAQYVEAPRSTSRLVWRGHRLAFGMLKLAYGANDGQKMLAVLSIAIGTVPGSVGRGAIMVIALPLFVGCLVGLRRVSRTLSSGVLAVRPVSAVAAELSAATAVTASSRVGAPVSMTQSIAGSLVGAGMRESVRKIRWRVVVNLSVAWAVTLPAAGLVAASTDRPLRGAL